MKQLHLYLIGFLLLAVIALTFYAGKYHEINHGSKIGEIEKLVRKAGMMMAQ